MNGTLEMSVQHSNSATPQAPAPDTDDEWFVGFFTELPNEFWRRVASPEMTVPEVDFIERQLGLAPGDRILDVPCGSGRHALLLAGRGFHVDGYDLSVEALEKARAQAVQLKLPVGFQQVDMRALPPAAQPYDAAICMGNSFGYLDMAATQRFLLAVARDLVLGGRLLIDFGATAESILPGFSEGSQSMVTGDIQVTTHRSYDVLRSRAVSEYEFVRGDQVQTVTAEYVIYTVHQLVTLLDDAGFGDIRLASGTGGEPFALGSPRLLLSAVRCR